MRGSRLDCDRADVGFLPLVVLLLGVTLPLHAQAGGDAGAEAQVARLVARYDSAWNGRDTATVGRLLSPRYQYFTSRGEMSSRAETMTTLADPDYVLRQARRSELTVTPSGPVAIVASRWQGDGTYKGEAFTDDQRCGQTWVRAGATWQLLSEHCVQIAPRPPAN